MESVGCRKITQKFKFERAIEKKPLGHSDMISSKLKMDVDDVRLCLRALLSSTTFAYTLRSLLNDFKGMTGFDLPLFGCPHPVEFLRTLNDTVQLFGDPINPQIALVESKKSAHITSLVDRQKTSTLRSKSHHFSNLQRRLIIPDLSKKDMFSVPQLPPKRNFKDNTTSQKNSFSFVPPRKPEEQALKTSLCSYASNSNAVKEQKYMESSSLKNDVTTTNKAINVLNGKINSDFSQEFTGAEKVEVNKPLEPSQEKSATFYFEDVVDIESGFNKKDTESDFNSVVNEGIKNKFRKLLKNYPDGLWCCELPQLFLKEFKYVLDYREFGYTSLIQMLSELPDVFRCVRPGRGDWILFDASAAPTEREQKMKDLESAAAISCDIKRNLRSLLINIFKKESEIELNKIMDLYQKIYGTCPDLRSIGFKDLKSLLETWEDDFLNFVKRDGKTFVVEGLKQAVRSPIPWEEAIPPITAENDIFAEIFPKDVVGPNESFLELDLMRHVAVGNTVEVSIAEVWSPEKFYLQLNKFKKRLNGFMDDLQSFYNVYLHKYKMPDSTIRPNQVCVGLYNSDPDIPEEWHRAQILKVINEKIVLINFVDYGTVARLKKTQLRFLHRSFLSFPIQAFLAQLSGIVPRNNETKWPMSTSKRFLELTRVVYLKAEINEIDFKVPRMSVTLFDPFEKSGISINQKLVTEKLASAKESEYDDPFPEVVAHTRLENSETTENQKKVLTDISPNVPKQENLKQNLPELRDEFSDIADLGHTSLFHFKMKSLKLEESFPIEKENKSNTPLPNPSVSFEFEEVPDLEKDEKKVFAKVSEENKRNEETAKSFMFENEENPPVLKGFSLIQPKIRNSGPRPDENLKKPPQPNTVAEQTSSSAGGKPNRLPPGLEHLNVLPNFSPLQFYLQPEDYKKMVNVMAMELMATRPSIKQVGVNNPALALEIATEMAEAYIASQYPRRESFNLDTLPANPFSNLLISPAQLQPKAFEVKEPAVPVVPVFPVSPPAPSTERTTPISDKKDFMPLDQDESETSPLKEGIVNEYIKMKQIGDKTLHLVTIDDQMYLCAEEVIRKFTLISNREIADRVLHMKKFSISYRILTKNTDEKVLQAIKSSNLPVFKGKSKKLKVYLIPLAEVVPLLQTLGCVTKAFENDLRVLQLGEKREEQVS